eukprot:762741-Hanusia_phi.AAC.4
MVVVLDDVLAFFASIAFKAAFAKGIKKGSDWYVDRQVVNDLELLYVGAKGSNIDRRRRPWPSIRRLIDAYKTGDEKKFRELKEALRDCKDALTAEYQDALAEGLAQQTLSAIQNAINYIASLLQGID